MTRANANTLFQGLKSQPSFAQVIRIRSGDPEAQTLREARAEIRSTIRQALLDFRSYLKEATILHKDRDLSTIAELGRIKKLQVKFLTQGSFAYDTLIRPAQPEYQEIDLDDGVYIPMPFKNGKPIVPSAALFEAVENALQPLLKAKGWTFQQKDTCIRIRLTGQNAHIDLPLYAVEETEFQLLTERFAADHADIPNMMSYGHMIHKGYNVAHDKIFLADRAKDWDASDPKAIHDWFDSHSEHFGPVLKRVCCYTKAWRDNQWPESALSSLALMAVCVSALNHLQHQPVDNRDDLMMLKIAEYLPEALRNGIANPVSGKSLTEKWTELEKQRFIAKADQMNEYMNRALYGGYSPEVIIRHLRDVFGIRIPDAPDAVSIKEASQTNVVIKIAPATVPAPLVKSSISA